MAKIHVERMAGDTFRVAVEDGAGETVHSVTATAEHLRRYGGEEHPERLLEASFEFLLEREPKESQENLGAAVFLGGFSTWRRIETQAAKV